MQKTSGLARAAATLAIVAALATVLAVFSGEPAARTRGGTSTTTHSAGEQRSAQNRNSGMTQ